MSLQEIRGRALTFLLPLKAIATMTATQIDDITVAALEAILTNEKLAADIDEILKQVAAMRGIKVA